MEQVHDSSQKETLPPERLDLETAAEEVQRMVDLILTPEAELKGFHGKTLGSLSLTGKGAKNA